MHLVYAMDLSRFYFINGAFAEFISGEGSHLLKESIVARRFSRGQNIFNEGTYPRGVFLLKKGKIKIYQNEPDGLQQIMNIHVPGEIVGYRPLLCREKYPVSATAIEDCEVSFVPRKQFLQALEKSSTLSNMLLKFLGYEFTVWVNTISNLKYRTVRERLLLNLLILIRKYRGNKTWPVEITLSRTDLAALVGTSNETLARLLKVLKRDQCITVKGRMIVIENQWQEEQIRRPLLSFI